MFDISFLEPPAHQLWLIAGRAYGDDDDSVGLLWARDEEQAKYMFTRTTLNLSEAVLARHGDSSPEYFITRTLLLGSGEVPRLLLTPEAMHEVVRAQPLTVGPTN